jgi:hypothetical protein
MAPMTTATVTAATTTTRTVAAVVIGGRNKDDGGMVMAGAQTTINQKHQRDMVAAEETGVAMLVVLGPKLFQLFLLSIYKSFIQY